MLTGWGTTFSQCVPTPGIEAITNGNFENGNDGSSTFGNLVFEPLPTSGGYSNPGEYGIGTNPNDFSLNNPVFYDHTKKMEPGRC